MILDRNDRRKTAEGLTRFPEDGPTGFHAVENIGRPFCEAGSIQPHEGETWELRRSGPYFVARDQSFTLLLKTPLGTLSGFRLITSHSDLPSFRIREDPEMEAGGHYIKLNVGKYDGTLRAPQIDRPPLVANRLVIKEGKYLVTKLVRVDQNLLMIPNLVVHFNRRVDNGYKYNPQMDMLPLHGDASTEGTFMKNTAGSARVRKEDVLGHNLFLYSRTPETIWGADGEFISYGRPDDLQCMFASLEGFLEGKDSESVSVHAVFDNEEVGSSTRQGAGSIFLENTLKRINGNLGRSEEEYLVSLVSSFMISAGGTHAAHPNLDLKTDSTDRPYMDRGIIIKRNANQKYTTSTVSATMFKVLYQGAGMPFQVFASRSNIPGGPALGNISNAHAVLNTVGIDLPQLAIHSLYEVAGMKGTYCLVQVAKHFYSAGIGASGLGSYKIIQGQYNMFSRKQLIKLLVPLIAEQIMAMLVGMTNVVMMVTVGETVVSEVPLMGSIDVLITQITGALTTGNAMTPTQYLGKMQPRNTHKMIGQLVTVTLTLSMVVTGIVILGNRHLLGATFGEVETPATGNAQTYFWITTSSCPFIELYNVYAALSRSMDNSKVPMVASLVMNVINIAGNAVCVFGPEMGVAGMAYPTLLSHIMAAAMMLVLIQSHHNSIRLSGLKFLVPGARMIKNISSIGISGGLRNGMFQFGKAFLQNLVFFLDTAVIIGYAVANNLIAIPYLPGIAIGLGLVTIVGQCVGTGRLAEARHYARTLMGVSYRTLAVLGTTIMAFSDQLVGIYYLSKQASRLSKELTAVHSIAIVLWPLTFIIPHTLGVSLNVKFAMTVAVLSIWAFRIGFVYLFVSICKFGTMGMQYDIFIDQIFRVSVFLWHFEEFEKRAAAVK